jgi:hypothetical protein
MPDVESASLANRVPLWSWSMNGISTGPEPPTQISENMSGFLGVDRTFLQTMRIPLTLGRRFDERDTAASPPVAIVSESFAQEFFPDQNPLGRTFNHCGSDSPQLAAGSLHYLSPVADRDRRRCRDVRSRGPRGDNFPVYYGPLQMESGTRMLIVRMRTISPQTLNGLQRTVNAIDPELPPLEITTYRSEIWRYALTRISQCAFSRRTEKCGRVWCLVNMMT